MTSLEAALRQIHTNLTEAHVSFALVGGLAVSARTEPRFTRDADLAVAVASDAEAEALIHTLRARDYGIETVVQQEAVGRLATARLTRSSTLQSPVIDLLFASSGIEAELVAEAEPIELLPNLTIGVARTGHLIALKVLSRDDVSRPQRSGGPSRAPARGIIHRTGARATSAGIDCGSRISPRSRPHVRIDDAVSRNALIGEDPVLRANARRAHRVRSVA